MVCAGECNTVLEPGEMVIKAKEPTSNHTIAYHPTCWLRLMEEWLITQGTPVSNRGRRRLELGEEDRKGRLSLLRQHAANKQRIAQYRQRMDAVGGTDELLGLRIKRLEIGQELLEKRIEDYGGAPRRWGAGGGGS